MKKEKEKKIIWVLRRWLGGVVIVGVALFAGCGGGEPREISERRTLSEADRTVRLDRTSAQRFGFERPAGPLTGTGPMANPFRWEVPEGWEEVAPTSMRIANFRFGEKGEGECYLTALPGAAGGAAANINRWRGQMGAEPISAAEVAALPKKRFLGEAAPFVAVDGAFTGMGGGAARENYRLVGAILSYDQFTLFVKMIGPAEEVRAEEANFDAFCASVRIVGPAERSD